jgi:hypothetical protein
MVPFAQTVHRLAWVQLPMPMHIEHRFWIEHQKDFVQQAVCSPLYKTQEINHHKL